jgi:hypothetical protein
MSEEETVVVAPQKKEEQVPDTVTVPAGEYNPRLDPGPPRPEDAPVEEENPVELTSPEVPLEESRKDDTTDLATDIFNDEGQRVIYA